MKWSPGKAEHRSQDWLSSENAEDVESVDPKPSNLSGSETVGPGIRKGPLRIALYSHDTVGFGHFRRNLRIAHQLTSGSNPASVLMITGAAETGYFSLPNGADCLTLPALRKDAKGNYESRSLGVSLEQIIRLRASLLRAGLETFEPDVLIVDKVSRGALGELDDALKLLRNRGRTRCVLGLREVLDDPVTVRREWQLQNVQQSLRKYYDAIWIYGDPSVYDPVLEYGLLEKSPLKVHYTGYLDPSSVRPSLLNSVDETLRPLRLPEGRLALCLVGGGQDGAELANAFCRAILPSGMNGVILTGPLMPAEIRHQLRRSVRYQGRIRVLEFVANPEVLMQSADRVISMGGYNTVSEILAFGKQALIVPRTKPRREQMIRAERLRDLNLVDVLSPDSLSPQKLTDWLWKELPVRPVAREQIDFGGLGRLPQLLDELIATGHHSRSAVDPDIEEKMVHAKP